MLQFPGYLLELSEGDLKRVFSRHGRNLPDRWFDRQGCHRVSSSGNYRPHTQVLAVFADENECACSYYGNTESIRTPGTRLNWEDEVTLPIRLRPIRTCPKARSGMWAASRPRLTLRPESDPCISGVVRRCDARSATVPTGLSIKLIRPHSRRPGPLQPRDVLSYGCNSPVQRLQLIQVLDAYLHGPSFC